MTTHRIDRLQKRIAVPRGRVEKADRIDHAIDQALGHLVEAALLREGIRAEEQVCIDRLAVSLQLGANDDPEQVGPAFARAFAAEVRARLDRADPGVARYRSPGALLGELVTRVAARDFTRAWAWRSAGVWPELTPNGRTAQVGLVFSALARAPRFAAPVLSAYPRQAQVLVREAAEASVAFLALAVLESLGLPGHEARSWLVAAEAGDAQVESPLRLRALVQRARDFLDASPQSHEPSKAQRLIALLTTAPEVLRESVTTVLEAIERLPGVEAVSAVSAEEQPPRRPTPTKPERPPEMTSSPATGPVDRERRASARNPEVLARVAEVSPFATEFGGLLFLLHLVRELDLPARWYGDAALSALSMEELLHSLALTLWPALDAADPAALAFAGLRPNVPPPGRPVALTTAVLTELRDELVGALCARLTRFGVDLARLGPGLLEFVVRRRARIEAEPGWISAEFDLNDVSTELRRAGLDLDLGWLPFLGVVVRFTYA